MIGRSLRKLMTADVMAGVLVIMTLQIFSYGVSESLRSTDTKYFSWICLAAVTIGFGLGRARINGINASTGIAVTGILIVWILGARLFQPLLNLGKSTLTIMPQIIPALRFGTPVDTTGVVRTWVPIADASIALITRLDAWLVGFGRTATIDDALIRNMIWVLVLWLCSAWMGWFAERRKAVISFLPSLGVLTSITSYSEYKIETVWIMVILLLVLMGVWNYKNHTRQWDKSRIDYSDSIVLDNGQAVLFITFLVGSFAFLTPSISWQDMVDYLRERQSNQTAEMLGIQEPHASGKPSNPQIPSMPRDHLLTGGYANSEKIVMTVRTGELPPILNQSQTINAPRYYWRSTIYDQYVGTGWVTSAVTTQNFSAETPLIPGLLDGYRVAHLAVELIEPEGRLFWDGILFSLDIPFRAAWRVKPPSDLFAGQPALLQADIFVASSSATSYQADVYIPTSTIAELRAASMDYPEEIRERYLKLPQGLPDRVRELAREITEGISNPYDRAKAIETYLRTNYSYDLEIPPPPKGRDVADYFLFELQKGYCDYYATSMVVLARSAGIPARFVSGYAPGSYDATNAQYIIRELNAHSWVEVYFPEIGWIEFEPTASLPEIQRAEEVVSLPEDGKNEETVSQLLTRFRFEKIFLWLSPAMSVLVVAILYFAFIERWQYLRLGPETAIDRIYQKFYLAGRPLAGEWTYAETSSEYVYKLVGKLNEIQNQARFIKLLDRLKTNAISLTDRYHSTLFINHQVNRRDTREAWNIWIQLRRQIYLARFLLFIVGNKIKSNKATDS